jgi:hypothetical protein
VHEFPIVAWQRLERRILCRSLLPEGLATRLRSMPTASLTLEFRPVTPERLPDLARFSESHGKFRYCSCMRWRMRSAEFGSSTNQSRVAALDRLVRVGTPVGVLAYLDDEPVGWCSVAPRETCAALERYRALPRIDDLPV